MTAIFKRELKSYFTGMTGWLYTAFIVLFVGVYTMAYNLNAGYSQFEYVLDSMSFVFMLAVPVLTMRVFSEERRNGTDKLLYSLPISTTGIVIAKFLAMLVVTLLPMVIISVYPVILSQYGNVVYKTAYGAIVMYWLLGAALASLGMFISSITESQVISAVITLVAVLIIYFMTGLASFVPTDASSSLMAFMVVALLVAVIIYVFSKNTLLTGIAIIAMLGGLMIAYAISSASFEGLFASAMEQLSLFERFYTIIDGVFDLTNIVYYLSLVCVNVFLTVQALEKRRWN